MQNGTGSIAAQTAYFVFLNISIKVIYVKFQQCSKAIFPGFCTVVVRNGSLTQSQSKLNHTKWIFFFLRFYTWGRKCCPATRILSHQKCKGIKSHRMTHLQGDVNLCSNGEIKPKSSAQHQHHLMSSLSDICAKIPNILFTSQSAVTHFENSTTFYVLWKHKVIIKVTKVKCISRPVARGCNVQLCELQTCAAVI